MVEWRTVKVVKRRRNFISTTADADYLAEKFSGLLYRKHKDKFDRARQKYQFYPKIKLQ